MERRYAPYPKWFGSAFKRLVTAQVLSPILSEVLQAPSWQQRETHLVQAYEMLAARHNALALTEPMPERAASFFGRPFQVMALHGFAEALLRKIQDPRVRNIARLPLIGSLDLFSDNTILTSDPFWRLRLSQLFGDRDT
jgi:hypothetical protein